MSLGLRLGPSHRVRRFGALQDFWWAESPDEIIVRIQPSEGSSRALVTLGRERDGAGVAPRWQVHLFVPRPVSS